MLANSLVHTQSCTGGHPQTQTHIKVLIYAHLLKNALINVHTQAPTQPHTHTHSHRSVITVTGRETAAIHSQ